MPTFRRARLEPGIYDDLVSAHLERLLAALPATLRAEQADLSKSEALSSTLRTLLGEALANAFESLDGEPAKSLALAESLLRALHEAVPSALREGELALSPRRLLAITAPPAQAPARPRGSLHASSLIVNAEGESLLENLRSEFDSADRVDLLCAFVKVSGFEKFREELERHCSTRGRSLRVLTTTYMGASDAAAVERFARLPNTQVKVSYDEHVTRLHAKAWIFHRASGFSSAYVGSSNLSHAAQTEGLEWNVRIAEADQPALLSQMRETFEQYWEDRHQFEAFDGAREDHRTRLRASLSSEWREDASSDALVELEAKAFQKPVLEELARARELGRHANLLVAATGTGKTVMAALDYQRLRDAGRVETLLYVAHRREILEQARRTFRNALQEATFGELLYTGKKPAVGRHVFASIDSLTEKNEIDPSTFDMVILDEAHHAAAETWDALLEKARSAKELLGLTGTPERTDGASYEQHFPRPWVGNLRVWNAIPHALVPFRYYMLDVEGVDLRDVAWDKGRYVASDLSDKLVDAAEVFVRRAVKAIADHIGSPARVPASKRAGSTGPVESAVAEPARAPESKRIKAIAFCASVSHANAVRARFDHHGFTSRVLTGETPAAERSLARADLDSGRVEVLCVVDIYNEGVDVPNVNVLFFFRPTESATVFLQQLGRGLRRTRTKAELVVFDLTGRQHLKFRFDRRLRALLGQTPRELRELVEHRRGRLPAGCLLHFDEQSQADVLAQIKRAIPSDIAGIRALLAEPAHKDLSLDLFLRETDVELGDIYSSGRSWTELRRMIGLDRRPLAEGEEEALKKVQKLTHAGDARRLDLWERLVRLEATRTEAEHRLARMLFVQLYGKDVAGKDADAAALWEAHPILREEIAALIPALRRLNAVLAPPHELAREIPLALHARYTGAELSAAFDVRTVKGAFRDFYTGTVVVGEAPTRYDLLLVTLNKGASTKDHLRYRDFPLSETRFHWQSQASTTRESATGQRHLHPEKHGITPLLFVRERTDERPGVTMAFQYLGPVTPHSSEGERPITIEWSLAQTLPAELLSAGRVA